LFSTAQIVAALFGGLHFEKIRTQRARAQQLELQNAITKGEVQTFESIRCDCGRGGQSDYVVWLGSVGKGRHSTGYFDVAVGIERRG
jgi:hypothetical protein